MAEYREATLGDAAEIADMMRRFVDCPWTEAQVCEEISNPDAPFLVAEADGEVVGFLSGVCASDECEISDIAVEPEYRRQKTATRLFSLMFDMLMVRGIKRAYLLVRRDNAAALGLYRKLGFAEAGIRRGYYGAADAVIMRLEL